MAKNKTKSASGIMTIGLMLGDRFSLLQLLPKEGSIATLRMVQELRNKLSPSAKEIETVQLRESITGDGKVTFSWNQDKDREKRIQFYGIGHALVVERLQKLESEKKLELPHVSLWNKFIEPAPQAPPA